MNKRKVSRRNFIKSDNKKILISSQENYPHKAKQKCKFILQTEFRILQQAFEDMKSRSKSEMQNGQNPG